MAPMSSLNLPTFFFSFFASLVHDYVTDIPVRSLRFLLRVSIRIRCWTRPKLTWESIKREYSSGRCVRVSTARGTRTRLLPTCAACCRPACAVCGWSCPGARSRRFRTTRTECQSRRTSLARGSCRGSSSSSLRTSGMKDHCFLKTIYSIPIVSLSTYYRYELKTGPLYCFASARSWFVTRNRQK